MSLENQHDQQEYASSCQTELPNIDKTPRTLHLYQGKTTKKRCPLYYNPLFADAHVPFPIYRVIRNLLERQSTPNQIRSSDILTSDQRKTERGTKRSDKSKEKKGLKSTHHSPQRHSPEWPAVPGFP